MLTKNVIFPRMKGGKTSFNVLFTTGHWLHVFDMNDDISSFFWRILNSYAEGCVVWEGLDKVKRMKHQGISFGGFHCHIHYTVAWDAQPLRTRPGDLYRCYDWGRIYITNWIGHHISSPSVTDEYSWFSWLVIQLAVTLNGLWFASVEPPGYWRNPYCRRKG